MCQHHPHLFIYFFNPELSLKFLTFFFCCCCSTSNLLSPFECIKITNSLHPKTKFYFPIQACSSSGNLFFSSSTGKHGNNLCVQLFATLWTIACQVPLSMGFSKQQYWSGLPFPPPGDLPNLRIKPTSLKSFALEGGFFTTSTT